MTATTSFHTGFVPLTPAEADRDRDAIARELGSRYRVDRYLARGGFATVWQAADLVEGLDVAIKRVEPTVTRGRDFFRELRALLVLNHPNVVRLVNFLDAVPSRFLILELCRGGSLRAAISNKRRKSQCWTPASVTRLVREIASGLAAAHAAGLTHRDLKPENVLFAGMDTESSVKLADFGLAGLFHDDTGRLRSLTGSPAYMAPEQFTGRFNPASDVYALGIIAFELLTGELPFRGTPEELARQHLHESLPTAALPHPWQTLLPRMLAKNPDERPTAAEVALAVDAKMPVRPEIIDETFAEGAKALILDGDRIGIAYEDRLEILGEQTVPIGGVQQFGRCKALGNWYRNDTALYAVQNGVSAILRRRARGLDQWQCVPDGDSVATFELAGDRVSLVHNNTLAWCLTIPGGGLRRRLAVHSDGTWAVTAFERESVLQVRDRDGALRHSTPLPGFAWHVVPWSSESRFALRVLTGAGFQTLSTRTRDGAILLPESVGTSYLTACKDGILAVTAAGELKHWDARRRLVPMNFTVPSDETVRGAALTPTHALVLSVGAGNTKLRRIPRPETGETP